MIDKGALNDRWSAFEPLQGLDDALIDALFIF